MASLFRRRRITYQLPGGKHRTPDGQRVTKHTPGAVRVDLGRSEIYYGRYKTAAGFQTVPLCADKTASKQMLAKLVTDAKLGAHGLGDALAAGYNSFLGNRLEAFGPTHLEEVTVDWLRRLCGLPETAGNVRKNAIRCWTSSTVIFA